MRLNAMLIRRNSEPEASAAKVLAVAEGHRFACLFVRSFVSFVSFVYLVLRG